VREIPPSIDLLEEKKLFFEKVINIKAFVCMAMHVLAF
jgi:hypothetical protein